MDCTNYEAETPAEPMMSEIERIAGAITDKRAQLIEAESAAARVPYLREELATLYAKMRAELGEPKTDTADLDPTLPSGPFGDEPHVADAVSAELDRPAEAAAPEQPAPIMIPAIEAGYDEFVSQPYSPAFKETAE